MSGVAVIRHLLTQSASVLALVPATRIISGTIPQKTGLPSIGVAQISGVPRNTVAMNEASRMISERVQVTVLAATYPAKKQVFALLRAACSNQRGTVNGITVDSILPDQEGPDLDDVDAAIFEQSMDFIVKWKT